MIFVFLLAEVALRIYQKFSRGVPLSAKKYYQEDPVLGWTGQKKFGDLNTDKYKIFILGDSFTRARGIESTKTYYHVLKKMNNVELFVYAADGYGTLQEYLVLDRYIDEIQPDLILLQVCSNDFFDNSWKLETKNFSNRIHRPRPYLIDGQVEIRYQNLSGKEGTMFVHSRFLLFVRDRIGQFLAMLSRMRVIVNVADIIKKEGMKHNDFRQAAQITAQLISRLKGRAESTPLIAFTVDDQEPYKTQFLKIFQQNQIILIEEVAQAIKNEEAQGAQLRLSDGSHWNREGHHLAGEILFEIIGDTSDASLPPSGTASLQRP